MGMSSLFPAWAGVIPCLSWPFICRQTFPRMGGGDPAWVYDDASVYSLFPAWAGVIPGGSVNLRTGPAFPRMGGGDPVAVDLICAARAFSPHGRG